MERTDFDDDKFNEDSEIHKQKSIEEFNKLRIESLERLLPEMIQQQEKRSGRRLLLAFIIFTAVIFLAFLKTTGDFKSILYFVILAPIFSVVFLIIVYIISSFTFCKNLYEAMIIEKLKTEYYTLINKQDPNIDMLLEISKLRTFL